VPNRLLRLFSEFPPKVPNRLLWMFSESPPTKFPIRCFDCSRSSPSVSTVSWHFCIVRLLFVVLLPARSASVAFATMSATWCQAFLSLVDCENHRRYLLVRGFGFCCCCCCCFPPRFKSLVYVLLVLLYSVFFLFLRCCILSCIESRRIMAEEGEWCMDNNRMWQKCNTSVGMSAKFWKMSLLSRRL